MSYYRYSSPKEREALDHEKRIRIRGWFWCGCCLAMRYVNQRPFEHLTCWRCGHLLDNEGL